jgi:hypothetical protein
LLVFFFHPVMCLIRSLVTARRNSAFDDLISQVICLISQVICLISQVICQVICERLTE